VVSAAADEQRVALEQQYAAPATPEGERGREPGEAGTEDDNVGTVHGSDDL
jgi:hypothetical protein